MAEPGSVPSPYSSVLSSASPDFDPVPPKQPPPTPTPVPAQRGRHAMPTPPGMPLVQARSTLPYPVPPPPPPAPHPASPPQPSVPYPAAAPPAPPPTTAPTPPRGLSRGTVVLLVVVVVLAVLGTAGYFVGWPVYTQSRATLVLPDELSGLPKVTDPAPLAEANAAMSQLAAMTGTQFLIVAYLANDDRTHPVIFLGTAKFTLVPSLSGLEADIRTAIGREKWPVSGLHKIDPGPLGGVAACGSFTAAAQPAAVCGWRDSGSEGILAFLNRTPADGAVLMRAFRPQLVHR